MEFPHEASRAAVATALREDAVGTDLTTAWSVPAGRWASARILARRPGGGRAGRSGAQFDQRRARRAQLHAENVRHCDADSRIRLTGRHLAG